ncbi:hypothetical protein FGIG_11422 [Fasciola gigantica]|uniref:Uncharacterized protein n=1 Tax=Fasciola gigantica TaxID=46835 RepID=A0A504YLK8_FASGI|nr:hypothetical protein FGIG_11422 [Fasciola gigantica]
MVYSPTSGMLINSDSRLLASNYGPNENAASFESCPNPEMLSMIRQHYAITGPAVTVTANNQYSTSCVPPVPTLPAIVPGSGTVRGPDYCGSESSSSPIMVNHGRAISQFL